MTHELIADELKEMVFLGLEYDNGDMLYEGCRKDEITPEVIGDALEEAPVVYIFQACIDEKYGLQPATHWDPIEIYRNNDES